MSSREPLIIGNAKKADSFVESRGQGSTEQIAFSAYQPERNFLVRWRHSLQCTASLCFKNSHDDPQFPPNLPSEAVSNGSARLTQQQLEAKMSRHVHVRSGSRGRAVDPPPLQNIHEPAVAVFFVQHFTCPTMCMFLSSNFEPKIPAAAPQPETWIHPWHSLDDDLHEDVLLQGAQGLLHRSHVLQQVSLTERKSRMPGQWRNNSDNAPSADFVLTDHEEKLPRTGLICSLRVGYTSELRPIVCGPDFHQKGKAVSTLQV